MLINKLINFPNNFLFNINDYCSEKEFKELNFHEYFMSLFKVYYEYNSYNQKIKTQNKITISYIEFLNKFDYISSINNYIKINTDYFEPKSRRGNTTKLYYLITCNKYMIDKLTFDYENIKIKNIEQNKIINKQLIEINNLNEKIDKLENMINNNILLNEVCKFKILLLLLLVFKTFLINLLMIVIFYYFHNLLNCLLLCYYYQNFYQRIY